MINSDKTIKACKLKVKSAKTAQELASIRTEILGRKGLINQLLGEIKNQPLSRRKAYGKKFNKLKTKLESLIATATQTIQPSEQYDNMAIEQYSNYFSLHKLGHLHPITLVENEINDLFRSLGFSIYDGPEIETDEFCFQRLNVPPDHPARDMQDTLYINEPDILLRTQTSSIEARLLSQEKPPFKAAFPGKVYRNENVNKSNHFIFHQYQGVAVDKKVTMKDLIGTFDKLFKRLYGPKVVVRYRCKYYPEVEPGVGPDLLCFKCRGKGCSLCKGAGWIEIAGAGMIHPNVLKMAGINPKMWHGFAFGLGLDRLVMAKYNIGDIRALTGGNLAYKPNK